MLKGYSFGGKRKKGSFSKFSVSLVNYTIEHGEMFYALNNERFQAFNSDDQKVKCSACEESVFGYYYNIFENYEYFGLPHGGGWEAEQDWVLRLIKRFKSTKEMYRVAAENEAHQAAQARSKVKGKQ